MQPDKESPTNSPNTNTPQPAGGIVTSNNPQPAPAAQPPAPTPTPSSPPVIYGNSSQTIMKSSGRGKFILGAVILIVVLLVISAAAYFYILPNMWANQYLSNVKTAYLKQSSQMPAVYQSLARPVFSSASTTEASNTQDFNYINGVLSTASISTKSLQTKDHLEVLPGTSWNNSVTKANKEYQSMQQYVSDSQRFLSDYQTLVNYTAKVNQIGQTQVPKMLNDFNTDDAYIKSSNKAALITSLQTTVNDLQSFSSQVKNLKPSTDLDQFNQSLVTDISGMNNGLQGLLSALQGNNSVDILNSAAEFETSVADFVKLTETNPTANIQTNSDIHSQILNLQSEHPLQ